MVYTDMVMINGKPYIEIEESMFSLRIAGFAGIYKNGVITRCKTNPFYCIMMEDMEMIMLKRKRYIYSKETGHAYHIRIGQKLGTFVGNMFAPI